MNAPELLAAYVDDVVRHLHRAQRNDVGVELRALLSDELEAQAEAAGRQPDMAMATELLRRFGRPKDVAARYRQQSFPIIDAADAPAFVRLAAAGMLVMWAIGLVATFRGGGGLERLGQWWMTWGLGAFWWPGFLVVCAAVAAWIRRRFPLTDEWKPRLIDRDRINRPGWVLAIAWFTLGTIWLTSPAAFVEQLSGGRLAPQFYASFEYDEMFRQWRLPLLLTLLTAHLVLYAVLVAHGRWRRLTRRLDMALSLGISGLLVWSLAAGRIFQGDAGNRAARSTVTLIVVIVIWAVAARLYRDRLRVRMPAARVD